MSLKKASGLATVVLAVAVISLVFRHSLFADTPVLIALQVAAVVLMLWARLTFGLRSFHGTANPTAGGLVTSGPYSFVRNPIYAAILLFVWAGIAAHVSVYSVSAAVVASAMVAVRIGAEERLLREHYPEYAAYAARTKRVIPFIL